MLEKLPPEPPVELRTIEAGASLELGRSARKDVTAAIQDVDGAKWLRVRLGADADGGEAAVGWVCEHEDPADAKSRVILAHTKLTRYKAHQLRTDIEDLVEHMHSLQLGHTKTEWKDVLLPFIVDVVLPGAKLRIDSAADVAEAQAIIMRYIAVGFNAVGITLLRTILTNDITMSVFGHGIAEAKRTLTAGVKALARESSGCF